MVLTHYCVLTAEDEPKLLVMRPYQIVRHRAHPEPHPRLRARHAARLGTVDAGGYVWHTTGSGKTLTSFKCAQLASRMAGRRQGHVRRGPQGPRLPDHEGVQPLREGRGERLGGYPARLTPTCATTRSASASRPSRSSPVLIEKNAKHPIYDQPRRVHLRRVPPQPVRQDAQGDRQEASRTTTCSASRARPSSPRTRDMSGDPYAAHHRAGVRRHASTPTPSSTPSTTATCCRSA